MFRHIIVFFLLLTGGTWLSAKPQLMKTLFPVLDSPIADLVFEPSGSGDCSSALQSAIDRLHHSGGGTLFLPAGRYELHQPIRLRNSVTLRGDNPPVEAIPEDAALSEKALNLTRPAAYGTVLVVRHGAGQEEGKPAIEMETCGTGLRELVFWYPEQDGKTPFPWTVATVFNKFSDSQSIVNCRFVNSWQAIRIGPHWNELHTVRRTSITALKTGISMDTVTDIGRLDSVWLGPQAWQEGVLPGCPEPESLKKTLKKARGLVIHRSDWEYVRNTYIRGLGVGIEFLRGARGRTNAVMANVLVRDCAVGLKLQELNDVGLAVYGSAFVGNATSLETTEKFNTVVQFYNCRFAGRKAAETPLLRLRGKGLVSLAHGWLQACGQTVQADQGRLLAVQVEAPELVPFAVGHDMQTIRLLGGTLGRQAQLPPPPSAATELFATSALPEGLLPEPLPLTTGRRTHGGGCAPGFIAEKLLNVADFGASPSLPDNGPAFRAALEAARTAGCPTVVYVPAGLYPFASDIVVPSGVELRGCLPVPFHTSAGGSVLMPIQHRGQEDAAPFIALEANAGLRGMNIWYREQNHAAPVPYPWTIRALGQNCHVTDTNIGNAWNGLDLGSVADASGHHVNYLAGTFMRRGVLVANTTHGELVDMQFNPHHSHRTPQNFPRQYPRPEARNMSQILRGQLEGIILENTRNERLLGTFLFAANDGIRLRRGAQADIVMHGTDTAWRGARLSDDSRANFILAQLVPLGYQPDAAIVCDDDFTGQAFFACSQMWAGPRTASLYGPGTVILDQLNSCTGPIEVHQGRLQLNLVHFSARQPHYLHLGEKAESVSSLSTLAKVPPVIAVGENSGRYRAFANDGTPIPKLPVLTDDTRTRMSADFEAPASVPFIADTIAVVGGNVRNAQEIRCRVAMRDDAHSGQHAVLLSGKPTGSEHAFAYAEIFLPKLTVMPDTVLSYWMKPLNENGSHSGLDLLFSDGRTLRDMRVRDTRGISCHTGTVKGKVGQWTKVSIELGRTPACGKIIDKIMLAFDVRKPTSGDCQVLFDDISIETSMPPAAWNIRMSQNERGQLVIAAPSDMTVVYTLDGRNPHAGSKRYEGPFDVPGTSGEIRCGYLSADRRHVLPYIFTHLLKRPF